MERGERRHGSLFQIYEATDENNLDFAIAVFCVIVSAHTIE